MFDFNPVVAMLVVFGVPLSVLAFVFWKEGREIKRRKRERDLFKRREQQKRDQQVNVSNRIFNALHKVCEEHEDVYLHRWFEKDNVIRIARKINGKKNYLRGDLLVVSIDLFDEKRPMPVWVSYWPSGGGGYFGISTEEEIRQAIMELSNYIQMVRKQAA